MNSFQKKKNEEKIHLEKLQEKFNSLVDEKLKPSKTKIIFGDFY